MLGDHVTTDAGTGCVHTAPGHGKMTLLLVKVWLKYFAQLMIKVY